MKLTISIIVLQLLFIFPRIAFFSLTSIVPSRFRYTYDVEISGILINYL